MRLIESRARYTQTCQSGKTCLPKRQNCFPEVATSSSSKIELQATQSRIHGNYFQYPHSMTFWRRCLIRPIASTYTMLPSCRRREVIMSQVNLFQSFHKLREKCIYCILVVSPCMGPMSYGHALAFA